MKTYNAIVTLLINKERTQEVIVSFKAFADDDSGVKLTRAINEARDTFRETNEEVVGVRLPAF
jgi:hypothetical protein